MDKEHDYIMDYENFMSKFSLTEVSGAEVGEVVARMAIHYARYNVRMAEALRAYSSVKADFQNKIDPVSGKSMSSAKAEMLASATPEAATYELSKIHIQNIEQYLNSLKALQRGILVEFSNS